MCRPRRHTGQSRRLTRFVLAEISHDAVPLRFARCPEKRPRCVVPATARQSRGNNQCHTLRHGPMQLASLDTTLSIPRSQECMMCYGHIGRCVRSTIRVQKFFFFFRVRLLQIRLSIAPLKINDETVLPTFSELLHQRYIHFKFQG